MAAARAATGPGSLLAALRLWLLLWLWVSPAADAQYIQSLRWTLDANGILRPLWRPTLNTKSGATVNYEEVYTLMPHVVLLEWNCDYLATVCQNARQYLESDLNANRRWNNTFTFDADIGRSKARGDSMCHENWKRDHPCPEVAGTPPGNLAQPPIYRAQRIKVGKVVLSLLAQLWPTVDIKPPGYSVRPDGSIKYEYYIEDYVDAQGATVESKMEYTCDEFPMRSMVEGGVGINRNGPAPAEGYGQEGYTRCAPQRWCSKKGATGIKSEQDWQGAAQQMLHKELRRIGRVVDDNAYEANHFRRPTIYQFRLANRGLNDITARVISTEVNPPGADIETTVTQGIFKKRQQELVNDVEAFMNWANQVSADELMALKGTHPFEARHVFTNNTGDPLEPMEPPLEAAVSFADLGLQQHQHQQRDRPRPIETPDYYDEHLLSTADGRRKLLPRAHLLARIDASAPSDTEEDDDDDEDDASTAAPLLRNATQTDLEKALAMVDAAIDESSRLNEARYASPARNQYRLRPGTEPGREGARMADPGSDSYDAPPPPLLEMTPELATAAALVAEAEALQVEPGPGNGTASASAATKAARLRMRKRAGSFWMEHIAYRGTVPLGDNPSYKVFRNVMDYGARGDGVTDDTAAIQKAIDDGRRYGKGCNGSTPKNAIDYLPPGRYLVSRSIPVIFGTQLIDNAVDPPTIVASARFIGLGVLATDVYTGGGIGIDGLDQQWYVNTANFYRQIRNLRIDVTQTRSAQKVACLHYQIAQATSLQYVELIAKEGSQQRGIFAENGSGGMISDITFRGGEFGLYGGNQQFTAIRLTFNGYATSIQIIWD